MNTMNLFKTIKLVTAMLLLLTGPFAVAAIQGTPHDLVATSGGDSCRFCHTPHGSISGTPLWNHKLSNAFYSIYQSSSLQAKPGQPTGSSKLCLSCHDGTIALGDTVTGQFSGSKIASGKANLETDLSDDHPIGFDYSESLAAEDTQLNSPSSLPDTLKLNESGQLQCTTCHEPHDNKFGKFLTMSNIRSQMCMNCHDLNGWTTSAHQSSTATVLSANDPYLQASEYSSMADNGCANCHRPHSAPGKERLLHFQKSEDNCLSCHNRSVAKTNVATQMQKISAHSVTKFDDIHDLEESPQAIKMHVECVDCHNPHSVQKTTATAPYAKGVTQNVSGVTVAGAPIDQVQFEYELCFKCHSDNSERIDSDITRNITQTNTRLEFDPSGISFHPVAAPGKNRDVPSLEAPLTVNSIIYCTDCHSSDGSSSVKGPHGSSFSPLLKYNYSTKDFTHESTYSYALCYKCHSRNSILANQSFSLHKQHLEHDAPCSACHDAHGINSAQGTSTGNTHLINFDINIVQPEVTSQRLEFVDQGVFQGTCYLQCHSKIHNGQSYGTRRQLIPWRPNISR
ncbi:MAG: hypothetical protein K9M75_03230 [Phycisphaerae bacterium]|nr:hypothetical protein [Phycisphaerae bacterium]